MTGEQYTKVKEAIESKYHNDMAALDRVWVLVNGTRAPDGVLDPSDQDRLEVAEATRIAAATMPETPEEQKSETVAEKKRAYARAYYKAHYGKKAKK